jgi:hypothetical protein
MAAMRLKITDARTIQLARDVAALAGESIDQAVTTALKERLAELEKQSARKSPSPVK